MSDKYFLPLRIIGKFLVLASLLLLMQGMSCSEHPAPLSLPSIHLTDIHLQIAEPASGTAGVYIRWEKPSDGKVSYYEIFQSMKKDSLNHAVKTQAASESTYTILSLPDSTKPFTLYFAVRPIFVEQTGQKITGDTLVVDSLTLFPSFSILNPSNGTLLIGRILHIEVSTGSNPGIIFNLSLFENNAGKWSKKQEGCLPADACEIPIFGGAGARDSLILEGITPNDTVASLLCLVGTESFEGHKTGLNQSLGCSRYKRIAE